MGQLTFQEASAKLRNQDNACDVVSRLENPTDLSVGQGHPDSWSQVSGNSPTDPVGIFVGLTTFDVIHYSERFPEPDEKLQASGRWMGVGGPAANAAATFAALGGKAIFLTALGNGPLAQLANEELSSIGVRVVNLADSGDLPTSSVVVNAEGQRTVVSLNARGFDQSLLAEKFSPLAERPSVIGLDAHYPGLAQAVLRQYQRTVPIVLDPGSKKPHLADLMKESSHIIASRALDPKSDTRTLLSRIMGYKATLAAVSAGPEPLIAAIEGEVKTLSVPQVSSLDTLGAGDVLHGAYAFYIATGSPILYALEQAISVAAQSCERRGPRL